MKRNPTDERIRKRTDIRLLFRSSSVSVKGAKLFYRENNRSITRVLVTSGRGYGNAVARNYIKRVGRDIIRNNRQCFSPGYDVALVFYAGVYTYTDRVNQVIMLVKKHHDRFNYKRKLIYGS